MVFKLHLSPPTHTPHKNKCFTSSASLSLFLMLKSYISSKLHLSFPLVLLQLYLLSETTWSTLYMKRTNWTLNSSNSEVFIWLHVLCQIVYDRVRQTGGGFALVESMFFKKVFIRQKLTQNNCN